jgi:large subunit ribosomal protein L7/L12
MATMTQDDLLEAIDKMTVLELSEFIKRFEDRYGVTAAAPVAAAAAPSAAASGGDGAGAPAAVEEQTEFSAVLTEVGPNKIPVIKVVRELTQLGLKEAKDLVDAAPKPVKEGVTRDEADKIKAKLVGPIGARRGSARVTPALTNTGCREAVDGTIASFDTGRNRGILLLL